MAEILTQKILNNEILTEDLLKWLSATKYENENDKCKELSQLCLQKDFVTYFLNVIHDQLLCDCSIETPQKPKLPSTTQSQSKFQRNLFNDSECHEKSKTTQPNFLNDSSQVTFNLSCTSSTPKTRKSYSFDSLDDHLSPINKSSNSFRKELENSKTTSFCLGDFIVQSRKSNSKKKIQKCNSESQKITPKRINPTNLNQRPLSNVFTKSENSFNFENSAHSVIFNSEQANRDVLKKEIEKISTKRTLVDENIMEQMKRNSESKPSNNSTEIFPNPKLVRFKTELEKIIITYEYLLKNGLVLNVIGELYFIISFLLNKRYSENSENCVLNGEIMPEYCVTFKEIFRTIHNVVFFACSMLQKFSFFLKSLDKLTLKYMSENERLRLFSPDFVKTLECIYKSRNELMLNFYESNMKHNICFVLETDNRSNFPSDVSFQSFKKQRDLFYEILKIWEDGHMKPGWSFEFSLGRKVRTLLSYHQDSVNFMRLSRLFMDQLLSTCGKNFMDSSKVISYCNKEIHIELSLKLFQVTRENTQTFAALFKQNLSRLKHTINNHVMEEISTNTSSSILTSLPKIDKDKFDRLKNRLVTKQSSNGISSAPDFTGYQEFYKDFIVISANPSFLRHLCDTFISEIIELNDTSFTNIDVESSESETDQSTRKAYVDCLKSLRILAKFLGFVESMPYKYENSFLSSDLVHPQIQIRNKVRPNFDVLNILQISTVKGTVTLCIPWLCKYLSMLDPVTLKTDYCLNVIKIMISLYRNLGSEASKIPDYNMYLVKYSIGWLFELHNFPHNIFFEELNSTPRCDMSRDRIPAGLDRLHIVDQNILYMFCPYLEEIKKLLTSKTITTDRLTVRHITPLTAVQYPKEVIKKNIENQLEEAFYNGHPASLRKTVDFIAERIASTCVKHLCYKIVPVFKREFTKKLQMKLNEWMNKEDENQQISLRMKSLSLVEEELKNLETLCGTEVDQIVENNLKNAVHSLLPLDCLPQMEAICVSTARRTCLDKVKQWTSTHIVSGILMKDIGSEIAKCVTEYSAAVKTKQSFVLPPAGSDVYHNQNTQSAAHILDKLRDLSVSLLSSSNDLEQDFLMELLDNIYKTLTQRHDVNEAIQFMICFQLVDFLLLLVTFQPFLVEKIQTRFFQIWKLQGNKSEELFANLLCQRNVMLLAQSGPNALNSWSFKAKFCVALLKEQLLSSECFESQCAGLFKSNLDEETLKNVTHFLRIFVDIYKRESKSSTFTFLLEFLSDYCNDL